MLKYVLLFSGFMLIFMIPNSIISRSNNSLLCIYGITNSNGIMNWCDSIPTLSVPGYTLPKLVRCLSKTSGFPFMKRDRQRADSRMVWGTKHIPGTQ